MARIKGPRKVHRYSVEFKLKAVKLSNLAGVQVCRDTPAARGNMLSTVGARCS